MSCTVTVRRTDGFCWVVKDCVNTGNYKLMLGTGTRLLVKPNTLDLSLLCQGAFPHQECSCFLFEIMHWADTDIFCHETCHCVNAADKVSFGKGTVLSVTPDVTPSPSVYRLTSKDDQDLEMCLITDYSPESLTLDFGDKPTNAVVEVATPENKQEASYLSTYWAKKDEMQCAAKHEGFGDLEGKDPESGANMVCVTGMSLHFRTDEILNMLSVSQLGLKILLMKGIIFNVLMTMFVWKKKNESNQMVQF